ncbi:MAG: hypothetical protein CL431_05515 [Acidimicrobiaceae bacterium]|jgi:predicted metal-dependent HD superfamily phosphohydrolase|nr:hypothetical protein [Acidimicrobiaceae bacterium]|tara:strand:+ start:64043 stop:64684 length:642 start_codon:yes stop_codon:yes gene_type:complete
MDGQNFDPTHRWFDLCYRNQIAINDAVAMGNQLVNAYEESHRHYHTIDHVYACLNLLDGLPLSGQSKDMLEYAIWFHDAIYEPQSRDSEEKSALLAHDWLDKHGVIYAGEVKKIIELTADYNQWRPTQETEQFFHDLDLAVLGSVHDIYQEYAEDIRKEYWHLNDDDYTSGRVSFLENIMEKENIYQTEAFHSMFELSARENIHTELTELLKK